LARDLDGDGATDLVLTTMAPPALLVHPGVGPAPLLEEWLDLDLFGSTKNMAAADLDGNGWPELFTPDAALPQVAVLLDPGRSGAKVRRSVIATTSAYTSLAVADLDGDRTPDFAGANRGAGTWLVTLLGADGSVRREAQGPAGLLPTVVALGALGGKRGRDLAVLCAGSAEVAIVLDPGGSDPGRGPAVPTIEKPIDLTAADLDGDGSDDLAVISRKGLAVHYGTGGGSFSGPSFVAHDPRQYSTDLAVADLDADGLPDLLVLDTTPDGLRIFPGRPGRRFGDPLTVAIGGFPFSLTVSDLDGDGRPDAAASCPTDRSVAVLRGLGSSVPPRLERWWIGIGSGGHLISDLDGDRAPDLVAFSGSQALVLRGRRVADPPPRFRRGDADGSGSLDISDPITIIHHLYLSGPQPACLDAADAGDDGAVDLSDAVVILARLFLGGEPLPAPGAACGPDPTVDSLRECKPGC
jgi:hypothetical protein